MEWRFSLWCSLWFPFKPQKILKYTDVTHPCGSFGTEASDGFSFMPALFMATGPTRAEAGHSGKFLDHPLAALEASTLDMWLWVKTNQIPFWGRFYMSGDWDVHWACGVLTHGHVALQGAVPCTSIEGSAGTLSCGKRPITRSRFASKGLSKHRCQTEEGSDKMVNAHEGR